MKRMFYHYLSVLFGKLAEGFLKAHFRALRGLARDLDIEEARHRDLLRELSVRGVGNLFDKAWPE